MGDCPICLTESTRSIWCRTPCGHELCFQCLFKLWEHGHRTCPLCRHDIHDGFPIPRMRPPPESIILSEERLQSIVRRMHVTNVMDTALRERSIPPLRHPPSLTIVSHTSEDD